MILVGICWAPLVCHQDRSHVRTDSAPRVMAGLILIIAILRLGCHANVETLRYPAAGLPGRCKRSCDAKEHFAGTLAGLLATTRPSRYPKYCGPARRPQHRR